MVECYVFIKYEIIGNEVGEIRKVKNTGFGSKLPGESGLQPYTIYLNFRALISAHVNEGRNSVFAIEFFQELNEIRYFEWHLVHHRHHRKINVLIILF